MQSGVALRLPPRYKDYACGSVGGADVSAGFSSDACRASLAGLVTAATSSATESMSGFDGAGSDGAGTVSAGASPVAVSPATGAASLLAGAAGTFFSGFGG